MTGETHAERRDAEYRSKLRFLLHSAAALASASIVTAGLGFVYWAVALGVLVYGPLVWRAYRGRMNI